MLQVSLPVEAPVSIRVRVPHRRFDCDDGCVDDSDDHLGLWLNRVIWPRLDRSVPIIEVAMFSPK